VKAFNDSAVDALSLSGAMVPTPPLAANVTVTTAAPAVTVRVNVQVPLSPTGSLSVPETTYVPTERVPVVEMRPEELTDKLGLACVVTNVTTPLLPSTVIGPAVYVEDAVVDTEPVVADV
jgi:hypothetical protein